MRTASLLIAAHNEGESLWKTVRSCVKAGGDLDLEVVVADDASTDNSIEQLVERYKEETVNRTIPMVLVTAVMWMAPASYLAVADETTSRVPEANTEPKLTTDEAVRVLERSVDAAELEGAALSLVESGTPETLNVVARFLEDHGFLHRLDSEDAHRQHFTRLRVFRVLNAIGALSTGEADALLVSLTQHELYQRQGGRPHRSRYASVIVASGHIREPSDALLDFLEEQVALGRAYTTRAVVSLGQMQADRAHDMIADRVVAGDGRSSWFTDGFAPLRNNLTVVTLYRRLIRDEAGRIEDDQLRNLMVQSLLRPDFVWGDPGGLITSPPRDEASTEVLRELLEIADIVLKREDLYEPRTLEDARSGREEIKNILADRKKDQREL